jgi:hypothetical protein
MPPVVNLNDYLPAVALFLSRPEKQWLMSQISFFVQNPKLYSEPLRTEFRDSLPALFYTDFPFRHPEYTPTAVEKHPRPFTLDQDEVLREVSDSFRQVTLISADKDFSSTLRGLGRAAILMRTSQVVCAHPSKPGLCFLIFKPLV